MSNLDVYWRSFFKGDSITLARALIQDNLEEFFKFASVEGFYTQDIYKDALFNKILDTTDLSRLSPIWRQEYNFSIGDIEVTSKLSDLAMAIDKNDKDGKIQRTQTETYQTIRQYCDFFKSARQASHLRNMEAHERENQINDAGLALEVASTFISIFENSLINIYDEERLVRIKGNLVLLLKEIIKQQDPNQSPFEDDDSEETESWENSLSKEQENTKNAILIMAQELENLGDKFALGLETIKDSILDQAKSEKETVINHEEWPEPEQFLSAEDQEVQRIQLERDLKEMEEHEEFLEKAQKEASKKTLTPQKALNEMLSLQRKFKAEFQCKNWENLAQGPWREQVIENKIKTVEDFLNNEVIKVRYEEYKEIIDKQINSKYGEEFFDIIARILFVKDLGYLWKRCDRPYSLSEP